MPDRTTRVLSSLCAPQLTGYACLLDRNDIYHGRRRCCSILRLSSTVWFITQAQYEQNILRTSLSVLCRNKRPDSNFTSYWAVNFFFRSDLVLRNLGRFHPHDTSSRLVHEKKHTIRVASLHDFRSMLHIHKHADQMEQILMTI